MSIKKMKVTSSFLSTKLIHNSIFITESKGTESSYYHADNGPTYTINFFSRRILKKLVC